MTFAYDDAKHLYTADGIPVISLTQMLQEDGLVNYSDVPPAILERKRRIGDLVASTAKQLDSGGDCPINDAILPYIEAWSDCVRLNGWTWEGIEVPFVANVEGFLFGVTPDRWGRDRKGLPLVVEIKCTYSQHGYHHIQTACQALGLEMDENCSRFVVYLDGKGKYKAVPGKPADYDEARRLIFEHALPLASLQVTA